VTSTIEDVHGFLVFLSANRALSLEEVSHVVIVLTFLTIDQMLARLNHNLSLGIKATHAQ
jgi:hypothetical protein